MLLARVSSGQRRLCLAIVLLLLLSSLPHLTTAALVASDFAAPSFQRTWERTDKPVSDSGVARTWVWGSPVTGALDESYDEAPGESRVVQYFDKSRMEDNSYRAADAPWDVTNGLLVVELMSGMQQSGDAGFGIVGPASVNVAGDAADPDAVTYADLGALRGAPPAAAGATITQRVDDEGAVSDDMSLASHGVTAAHRLTVPGIDHQIASVFWDYMNSTGPVWENGAAVTGNLFPDAYYATGFPITEAYWTNVDVGGNDTLVLLQCFERRCLTYTPTNAPEWRVEMGNVGLHYHAWRYAPPPPDAEALYVGFLNISEQTAAPVGPRREPNATPVAKGSISIVRTPGAEHDYQVGINVENAGEITGYEIYYLPQFGSGSTLLSKTFPDGASTLGSLRDGFNFSDLDAPIGQTSFSPAQFNVLLASGSIVVYATTTTTHPLNPLAGRIEKPVEQVYTAELDTIANIISQGFGSASFYFNAADNQVDYSVQAFANDIESSYLTWQDEDGVWRIIPLEDPQLGVPTGGSITSAQVEGGSVPLLAQQLFNGNARIVVTTGANPDGELEGTSHVMDPRWAPALWFAVMAGADEHPGRATIVVSWDEPDTMNVFGMAADVADITGLALHHGVRGQDGPPVLQFPIFTETGEINATFGRWEINEDGTQTFTLTQAAFHFAAQLWHFILSTSIIGDELRGQVQYPATLDPYGVYLAELTSDVLDATITIMLFHSGNQSMYFGEAVTWDMYCNGVDNLELVSLVADLGDVLAYLVPNNPDDFENGDGYCGSGGITLDDIGPGEPWLGSFGQWPPDGWTEDGAVQLRADMQSGTLTAQRIQRLWVNQQLGN